MAKKAERDLKKRFQAAAEACLDVASALAAKIDSGETLTPSEHLALAACASTWAVQQAVDRVLGEMWVREKAADPKYLEPRW